MNRSKKNSKSVPPEDKETSPEGVVSTGNNNHGLPPIGRPSKNQTGKNKNISDPNPTGDMEAGSSSMAKSFPHGSGEKKKKFSFFSNLFKSNKSASSEGDGKKERGNPNIPDDGMTSSSSYESVNSVDTTSSFTFVSSKKLRGKGHKGRRIPVEVDDPPPPPRPISSCSSSITGSDQNNSHPESAVPEKEKSNTLSHISGAQPHPKKLGTLGRIGVKMGLKKKYNLQSCESLEHLGSLPRQVSPPLVAPGGGKKKGGKKLAGPVSPRTSVVIEDEPTVSGNSKNGDKVSETPRKMISNEKEMQHKDEPLKGFTPVSSMSMLSPASDTVENPSSNSHVLPQSQPDPASNIVTSLAKLTTEGATLSVPNSPPVTSTPSPEPVACSSKSIQEDQDRLSTSGYTSDINTNTWSSSTKRKRRAPAPPADNKASISNVILIPGKKQDTASGVNNVELKSVKRLGEEGQGPSTSSSCSYPSGALRRRKSKEKSHSRPYSCSCSNSIFAHHSKYQTYHKRHCCDGHNLAHPSTGSGSTPSNGGTLGRSHVKGKKKAPPPPSNPFDDDVEIEEQLQPSNSTKDRNPENPYGNPFLDEDSDGNNNASKTDLVKEKATKSKSSGIIGAGIVSSSSSAPISTSNSNGPSVSYPVVSKAVITSSLGGISACPISRADNVASSVTSQLSPNESSTTTSITPISIKNLVQKSAPETVAPVTSHAVTITTSSSSSRPIASPGSSWTTGNTPTPPSSTPPEDNETVSAEDDEIAQNLHNDRQEQELLASAQGSLSSRASEISTPTTSSSSTANEVPLATSPITTSSSSASSGSKRIFNFSRKKNSNTRPQPDTTNSQSDMETLLNSSSTLMAQAKAVDDQVKAQLQEGGSKKQGGGGLFSSKTKKSDSSSPLSPPLSPTSPPPFEDSLENKSAAPRPWYKRGISSSSSPSRSPSGTKVKPTPIKLTHLTKFSDLDREAQRIVDENKRKSAELAFNQNARDLINIFNTAFTTAPSSSTTTTNSVVTMASTDGGRDGSTFPGIPCTTSPSSPPSITSTFLAMANASNARPYVGRSYANRIKTTEPPTDQTSVAVIPPQKNSNQIPTTITTTFSTDVKASPTPQLTTVLSATPTSSTGVTSSNPTQVPKPNDSVVCITSSNTKPITTAPSLTQSNSSAVVAPKPLIGESWACPRCTLRNPAWRALCEACYYRKFGANALNTTTTSNPSSVVVSNNAVSIATIFSTTTSALTQTTNSTSNNVITSPRISSSSPTPTSSQPQITAKKAVNGTQTETPAALLFAKKDSINSTSVAPPQQKSPPSCENFLSQHPVKDKLIKDEKLEGMKLNNNSTASTSPSQEEELDVEKLRQVRVAFYSKEQQGREQNPSMNLNIQMNDPESEDEVLENSNSINSNSNRNMLPENSASVQQRPIIPFTSPATNFDDGEDDSIDALLFRNQNDPPQRPPKNHKNQTQTRNPVISPDIGPNFELLLQPNVSIPPQAHISPPHSPNSISTNMPSPNGPIFRFRPMLEAITETDANYYTSIPNGDEVDRPVYQNWMQQPATPHKHQQNGQSLLITESQNGSAHFNAYPPLFMSSANLHNTSAVHPHSHLFMRQNISSQQDPLASHSSPTTTNANFRLFSNPIPPAQNNYNNDNVVVVGGENANTGFDLGSAFASNSHFLNSGFTSESEPEADSDMERHHRSRRQRGYSSRDNRYWNGHGDSGSGGRSSAGYPGERNLSYEDYRRLGAIPKGYGYPPGGGGDGFADPHQRRYEGGGSGPGSSCDSGRRRHHQGFNPSSRSQYGDEDDARYFSESSENSMADNPLVASKLLRKLEWAISHGEHRLAASLAHDLALLKVNCVVSKNSAEPITIRIYVEDRAMQQGPFLVQVIPTMTLKDLKSKLEGDWGIPAGFQKWILGKKMAEDDFISLADYDVVQDTMAFLYLVTPQIENLGGRKEKEVTPPPPPLPKKPVSSPSPTPQNRVRDESTNLSGNHRHQPTQNQLALSAPKKVASSAQTDDNSLSAPTKILKEVTEVNHKARLPDPVDDKKVPLYERPKSPMRGERPTSVGRTIPKEVGESTQKPSPQLSRMANNNSSRNDHPKHFMPNPGESHEKTQPSTVVPSKLSTTPSMANNKASSNIRPSPLSLNAKLANLRLAAEQAFGKSFANTQKPSSSQGPCNNVGDSDQVKNIHCASGTFTQQTQPSQADSSSVPQKKQCEIGPMSPAPEKLSKTKSPQNTKSATTSQNEKRQLSKSEPSIIASPTPLPNCKDKDGKQNKHDDDQVPSTSKAAKIQRSKPKAIVKPETVPNSEPVPKPRATKKPPYPDPEIEKIINLAQSQNPKSDSSITGAAPAVLMPKPNPEKVEGFCQTTLPFPPAKGSNTGQEKPSNAINVSASFTSPSSPASPPPLSPRNACSPIAATTSSPTPQNPKSGHELKQSSNMIVGNVLVTPIINHVLLGTSALLRTLSPFPSDPQNDTTVQSAIIEDNFRQSDDSSSPQKSNNRSPNSTDPQKNGLSSPKMLPNGIKIQPLPLRPNNNNSSTKPKLNQTPFKLPYFMQQLCAEELSKNTTTKPSSPPSKVKMIAEKFNSNYSPSYPTPNGKVHSSGLQRKYSDASNINANNNTNSGLMVGRRKSETAAGTMLTFSDESKESNIQTYLTLLQITEKQDLILNSDEFECPVCLTGVASGDGVTLRDCLHNFCKDCLVGAVRYSDESVVKCPFRDDNYACESSLQEREIKALVPPEVFEKYLTQSVRLAERKMMNTFHCKSVNCPGWCIFDEDDVGVFKCPVCNKKNCITCAAIHEDIDCQQYQRQLAIDAETDEDAKSSRLMLEKMIQSGDALHCPACHIILLKKKGWGCDWVRCTYCKLEICLATKGPRWGPGGRGDISGGCKCGVKGIKCHARCSYCH